MNNSNLLNRSMQAVWHPCTQMKQHENYPLIPISRDKVLFGKYAGQTVKVDGDELLVMREEDIMGIVE